MHDTASRSSRLKRILWVSSFTAGLATLLLGLLVIFGWHTGNRTLIQVLPSFVPMQYNTALGFVLCGASLVLLILRRERGSTIAGVLAFLVGGLTLVEYSGHVDLGNVACVDSYLVWDRITDNSVDPNPACNDPVVFYLARDDGAADFGSAIPGEWRFS